MKVFVPLSDDMLDRLPPDVELVPYPIGSALLPQLERDPRRVKPALNRGKVPEHRRDGHSTLPPCRR